MAAAADRSVRSPWVIAIIVGLIIMAVVNVIFIVVAVRGADPVVPSYQLERR
ncbi:MAG TPA: hypothetical protein VK939_17830 [Longimicrobiales bacterium]|nr:hypothetical protein [Longimicrobiales bacterium]